MNPGAESFKHTAFDVKVTVDDPLRAEMQGVLSVLNSGEDRVKAISELDERVRLSYSFLARTYPAS